MHNDIQSWRKTQWYFEIIQKLHYKFMKAWINYIFFFFSSLPFHLFYFSSCYFFNFSWVTECGDVFRKHKHSWAHLIPSSHNQKAVLAEHFFSTASSLMARQLREAMESSLDEFISFLQIYQVMW